MMKIVVTGANGFIARNLITELNNKGFDEVFEVSRATTREELSEYLRKADFVFHLAGVNRTQKQSEFMLGNFEFTYELLNTLKIHKNTCPVMISSSIQAEFNNPYGESKKAVENLLFAYGRETGANVLVYRFPNVFGKWCKPNYNSVIATFSYEVSHGVQIHVNDPSVVMKLVYIDDVIVELINALESNEVKIDTFCVIPEVYTITLGEIVELIYSFKKSRDDRSVPDMTDEFTKKLYSTYLSYLPENQFCYNLKMNIDQRGSFTEFIKTSDRGQVSVNISKPGITKGNHWHHTKIEKFLVVSGKGVIRFRKIYADNVLEYYVSGDKMEVVDIPPGYTHNLENLGDTDMVTIMWANESFNYEKPDTYYLDV